MINIEPVTAEIVEILASVIEVGSACLLVYWLVKSIKYLRDLLDVFSPDFPQTSSEEDEMMKQIQAREDRMQKEQDIYDRTGYQSARLRGISESESRADQEQSRASRKVDGMTDHEHYSNAY